MLGAVVRQELLLAGRRQRGYFLRWIYAALLLSLVIQRLREPLVAGWQFTAYATFFGELLTLQFAVIFLVTPALVAGAITDEKTRGTLGMLLTVHLRPIDIVLGKLLGRGYQIGVLALTGMPLVAFFGVLGGLPPTFAPAVLAVSFVLIVAIAALSILASVWCRQTRDAVLCTYLVILAGGVLVYFAAGTPLGWLAADLDPWRAVALDDPPQGTAQLGRFALVGLVPAGLCTLLAAWRLRPAFLRQLRSTDRVWRPGWLAARAKMRGNPVAWRERCVQGIAPLAWMRLMPRWPALVAVTLASAAGLIFFAVRALPPGVNAQHVFDQQGWLVFLQELRRISEFAAPEILAWHGVVVLLPLVLLVAIRASGCITEEREKGTWDALMLTPISTKQIVHGKFWGIVGAFLPYLVAIALSVGVVSVPLGIYGIVCGLFAVTVLFIVSVWVAAFGVLCSAHSQSSWRSLLVTLAACIVTVNGASLIGALAGGCAGMTLSFLVLIDAMVAGPGGPGGDVVVMIGFLLTWSVVWAFVAWLVVQNVIRLAVQRINTHDRTRVTKGFSRDYINWRLDRSEERRREKIAEKIADPVPIVDDEA